MSDKIADNLVENVVTLPTIPSTLAKLNQAIEDPESSANDIAEVVVTDQSAAAKVLRIANSSFYGLRTKVNSVTHGVSILGTRVLRNLVLQATTIQAYEHLRNQSEFDIDAFWQESILCAAASQTLAGKAKKLPGRAEDYYSMGLIRDIGRVVLLDSKPEQFLESIRWAKASGEDMIAAETKIFGFAHTHVGEALAKRWKLSDEAAYAIRHHHSPPEGGDSLKLSACLVMVADQLVRNIMASHNGEAAVGLDPVALDLIGIPIESTPELAEEIAARAQGVEV